MKKLLLTTATLALISAPTFASYGPSSINPNLPANNSPLSSSVMRSQFLAAYNDLNSAFTGINSVSQFIGITFPLSVANGGIGTNAASGVALDNITGFTSTGVISRSGSGTYTFSSVSFPPSGTLTNTAGYGATGTWDIDISGVAAVATTALTVTTNANLTGDVTSVGNATTLTNSSGARSHLGLGSIATQEASSVAITGGTISGVTASIDTLNGVLVTGTTGTGKIVFSASPTFTGTLTAPTVVGNLTGNADTATSATTATNAVNIATVTQNNNASFYPVFVQTAANANQTPYLASGLSFNPASNTLTTTTFSGALHGNADTATTTYYATESTNIFSTDDNATNADFYPVFQSAVGGANPLITSSTGLKYNPSTGTLSATNLAGNFTGSAAMIATTATSGNASFYPLFVASTSNGNQAANLGSGLSFNPSTNTLTTTTFSGALSGNATTAGTLTGALSANQVLGSLTATAPTGLSVPSCSGATNALIWSSGTGFGCNTISAGTGSVASVTFTGDGVLLSATPSSAVTTSGTVTATLNNAAAYTILGNNTAGSAAPSYLTSARISGSMSANQYEVNGTQIAASNLSNGTTGANAVVLVNSAVSPQTSNYTLTTADSGVEITNTGASGTVTYTLPPSPISGENHCATATTANVIVLAANTGQTIRQGNVVSSSAGNFTSDGSKGSRLCVKYLNTNEWYVSFVAAIWGAN